MYVGKQFDIVLGVDIHIIQPPGPVPPVPVPHPFVGIVYDPMEFVPILGASNMVNGIPRAQAGTTVKATPPHFPIGGVFVKPPSNDGEIFMGSMSVPIEGEPFPFLGAPVLTCQDAGMLPIPRPKRKSKSKPKSMVLPMSVLLPIPKGGMSFTFTGLIISMQAGGMKAGGAIFSKLKKSKKIKNKAKKFDAPSGRKFDVFQRTDIDWKLKRKVRVNGKTRIMTNLEAAKLGRAPIVKDAAGKKHRVTLHHHKQNKNGPLVEMLSSEHSKGHGALHGRKGPSKIDRSEFKNDQKAYWKERAKGV
jgi:uncharacterized Zn-binding protein involved in type VI secretion